MCHCRPSKQLLSWVVFSFDCELWPLTFDIQIWPRSYRVEPACQMARVRDHLVHVVWSENVWFLGWLCAHRVPEPKSTTQTCSTKLYSIYVLSMLLLTYLVNQLDRFLLGIVTQPMSQELDYGDWACMRNRSVTQNGVVCNATSEQEYVCLFSIKIIWWTVWR